jgi:membrane fusion protein (multidrug efflux system)
MSQGISHRLPFLSLIAVLVILIVYIQWPSESLVRKKHQRVISVNTVMIERSEFKDVIEALGTSRANEQVLITSKYADMVDGLYFNDGDVVQKGDILLSLNNQEEQAKVLELEANLAESVAQLNRLKDLFKKHATSTSQVEQQEAKTKAISAQLTRARTKLHDLTIKAPFAGVLGFRQVSLGAFVRVGDVLTSLDDLSVMKVDFSLPERFLTTIAIGQTISATSVAYQGDIFQGKVTAIDSRIDENTRMLKVRAEIPNADLKLHHGMLLTINIERQTDMVLQIPESAIIPIEDKHFVFVIEDNKALRKSIKVGRRQPGIAEVLNGLVQGEQIVIEGALKLRDGSQVKVLGDQL